MAADGTAGEPFKVPVMAKLAAVPLIVLNIHTPRAVSRAIRGERIGTLVR